MKKIQHISVLLAALCLSLPGRAQQDSIPPIANIQDTVPASLGRQDTLQVLQQQLTALQEKLYNDSVQNASEKRQATIWRKSKPLMLAYAKQSLTDHGYPGDPKYKSGFAFSSSFRRTFYLHKKAFGGMVKLGMDVTWFDISFAHYSGGKGIFSGLKDAFSNIMGNTTEGTYANADDYFAEAYDNANDYSKGGPDFSVNDIDVGKMQFSLGIAGVGPSIKIAPFYPLNKPGLDKIKVTLYFHYQPTVTGVAFTGDKAFFSGGYVGMWRYGANIAYHRWGIGFEHQWGSAKLKTWTDEEEEDGGSHSGKRKFDFSSTRFYIAFRI